MSVATADSQRLRDIADALAAGAPAGVLGSVTLPVIVSGPAAVVHSARTPCPELRTGDYSTHSVNPSSSAPHQMTVAEMAERFGQSTRLATFCTQCAGEDTDSAAGYAEMLGNCFGKNLRAYVLEPLRTVEHGLANGEFRSDAPVEAQRTWWRRLGALREALMPDTVSSGEAFIAATRHAIRDRANNAGPDFVPLADWYDAQIADATARVHAALDRLRTQLHPVAGRRVLVLATPEPTLSWWSCPLPAARLLNHEVPVGWVFYQTCPRPVMAVPANRLPAMPCLTVLGFVDDVPDGQLGQQLAAMQTLLRGARPGEPLASPYEAFHAAALIVTSPRVC